MHKGTLVAQVWGQDFYEMTASDDTVPFGVEIRLEDTYLGNRPYSTVAGEFDVFRGESDDFSEAVHLDQFTIPFKEGATVSVIDFEALPGKVYHYWLASPATPEQPNPVPFLNDTGYWNDALPGSMQRGPGSIEASNGISDEVVEITWLPAPGSPVAYEISRHSASFLERTVIGTVSGSISSFSDDSGAIAKGSVPWEDDTDWGCLYWVQAIYADGSRSGFGFPDRGYRSRWRVEGVRAERIDHSAAVRISWQNLPDFYHPLPSVYTGGRFQVFRAPGEDPTAFSYLGAGYVWASHGDIEFIDETAEVGKTYFYWVRFACYQSGAEWVGLIPGSWSDAVSLDAFPVGPPNGLTASSSETRGIHLRWDPVVGAVGFDLYRKLATSSLSSWELVDSVEAPDTNFFDAGVGPGRWEYRVESVSADGFHTPPSLPVLGERLHPPPPQTFAASDGDFADFVRLTWTATEDVDGFFLRTQGGTEIAEIPAIPGTTSYTFDDPAPVAGESVTYFINSYHLVPRATGPPLRVLGNSLSDQGHRLRLPPLPGPEAVNARNVADPMGGIMVEWSPVADAEGYQIFVGSQKIGEVVEGPFIWQGGYEGQLHAFTVRAWRENGGAGEAGTAVSVRKAAPVEDFSIEVFGATGRIDLRWESASGLNFDFEIFRSITPEFRDAVSIGTTDKNFFQDATAPPTIQHWYWVASRFNGESLLVTGPWTATRPFSPPSQVSATERKSFDHVELAWANAIGASSYRIYRAETADFGSASLVAAGSFPAGNGQSMWRDSNALPGVSYYYWVSAIDATYG
ncbi:MAG: hypothetical protein KDN19_17105, partial [Verrucomicrobiae bacterium]|nr:hypothetical protein [Verrucomicrobiae bacterium]